MNNLVTKLPSSSRYHNSYHNKVGIKWTKVDKYAIYLQLLFVMCCMQHVTNVTFQMLWFGDVNSSSIFLNLEMNSTILCPLAANKAYTADFVNNCCKFAQLLHKRFVQLQWAIKHCKCSRINKSWWCLSISSSFSRHFHKSELIHE
jgi:hypothetical protein